MEPIPNFPNYLFNIEEKKVFSIKSKKYLSSRSTRPSYQLWKEGKPRMFYSDQLELLVTGNKLPGQDIPEFPGYRYLIGEKKVFSVKYHKFIEPRKTGERLEFRLHQNGKEKSMFGDKLEELITSEKVMHGKPIPNFPNYSITRTGDVYNVKTGRQLKPSGEFYFRHTLSEKKYIYTHKLVAETYIPNPRNYPVVNHKNGNSLDNRVENLEWCTKSHDSKHAHSTGLNKGSKRAVVQYQIIEEKTDIVTTFQSASDASKKTKIPQSTMATICRLEKKYKGFQWRYLEEKPTPGCPRTVEMTKLKSSHVTIQRFESAVKASAILKIQKTSITRACQGKRKFAGGYSWKYENERENKCDHKEWKKIPGFSKYKISREGEVYSTFQHRKLSIIKSKKGYLSVSLNGDDGKRKKLLIHRLVCKTYSTDTEKRTVNHKDGKKGNNVHQNLEWNTNSENILHADRTGLRNIKKPVIQFNRKGKELARYRSIKEAADLLNIKAGGISDAARGYSKSYKGYIWKYVE